MSGITTHILPDDYLKVDIGSAAKRFKTIYVDSLDSLNAVGVALAGSITPVGCDAVGGEDVLHTFTIPGGTLATNGQFLEFYTILTTAANANAKRARVLWGSSVLADTGTFVMNNRVIVIEGRIHRTGSATQVGASFGSQSDVAGQTWNVGVGGSNFYADATETLALPVVLKVAGEGVAANDIVAKVTTIFLRSH